MFNQDSRQVRLQERARRILSLPSLQEARQKCSYLWSMAHGIDVPADASDEFPSALDEYLANYVLKALASDGGHPEFVTNFLSPWDGALGSRMGGDNPDNAYRLCGIEHGGSYRVRGRLRGNAMRPSNVSFTLTKNYGTSVTADLIEDFQLVRAVDGSFEITIDGHVAGGRANHLTTEPGVKFLYVRDSLNDWTLERPYLLEVERIDAPSAPPLSDEAVAALAALHAIEDVPLYYWFHRLMASGRVNELRGPVHSKSFGGLITQASALGWARLAPDEVGILTYDPAEAAYAALSTYDWWFRSIDTSVHQSSLTSSVSRLNADGTITCVVSSADPGVHNWIDIGAHRTILMLIRWQGLPPEAVRKPVQTFRIIKRDHLIESGLPEVSQVTRGERLQQSERRRQDALGRWSAPDPD